MVNKDRKSEGLSDFPRGHTATEPGSTVSSVLGQGLLHHPQEGGGSTTCLGSDPFPSSSQLSSRFFSGWKEAHRRLSRVPCLPRCVPSPVPAGPPSCLWRLEGPLLLPVHSQTQVLQLLTHQLIHLRRQRSGGRVARGWGGRPGAGEDRQEAGWRGRHSLCTEPAEPSEGGRWPPTSLCLVFEPWP